MKQLFTDIGFQCWKNEQKKDLYIYRIISEIKKSLSNKTVINVYVVGHSYGGYVASEIVLKLSNNPNAHKLVVDTYASIYTLSRVQMNGVRMKQYMNKYDLALRCSKLNKTCIIWIPVGKHHNIIDEWKIHMDYPLDYVLNNLIKKLNTK
jgi:predicted lipase